MDWLLSLLPMALVAGGLTVAERCCHPARSDWRHNLQCWGAVMLAGLAVLPLQALGHLPALVDGAALPLWLGCVLFVLAQDLGEYAYHRAQHAVPALWAMHSLHHSDPEMSALTAQRHYWGDVVLKAVTVWPAAAMLVKPTPEIYAVFGVVYLWGFFAHARLDVNFGKWSWLINSPAYHRRHHARLPEQYNSNYASLLPLFDVICGSYREPRGFPSTGLDRRPECFREVLVWPLRQARREALPISAAG
jgi:sterol desaturase/sphingolipid hydroxylase (fatty acid hydroxylase superfamily)